MEHQGDAGGRAVPRHGELVSASTHGRSFNGLAAYRLDQLAGRAPGVRRSLEHVDQRAIERFDLVIESNGLHSFAAPSSQILFLLMASNNDATEKLDA